MISTAWRFILLHAPKTGGNALQLLLQPISDDRLLVFGGRDGVHRFGVRGPSTPHKHATLQDYARALDGRLEGWRVALTARDPLARAVSYYFSPHRWTEPDGEGGVRRKTPVWDRAAFLAVLEEVTPLVDFVTVDGVLCGADHLIRQERLADDFADFVRMAGLPVDPAALRRVNQSAGDCALRSAALTDPVVQEAVRARFACDYELLGGGPDIADGRAMVTPPTSAPHPVRPPLRPSSPTST